MEWFNGNLLQILTVLIVFAAMWSRNTAALCYAFLIITHDYLFHSYAETDGAIYSFSAGIFSAISIAACIRYRYGINDRVAYYLTWLSIGWMAANIATMYIWINYWPTEVLNPVFAIMNIISILVIFSGGKSEFNRTKLLYRHSMAFRLARKRNHRAKIMERGVRL